MREPVEIIPDAANYRKRILQISPVLGALVLYAAISSSGNWTMAIVALLSLGVALFWVWRFFARARITLDDGGLRYRRAFSETFLPANEFGTVVFVPELDYMDPRMDSLIAVTNTRGRGKIVMTAPFWTVHQMRHLSAAIEAPVEILSPARLKDVQREHPRALPLYLGRPVVLTLSVIFALCAAIAAVVGLAELLHIDS